MEHKTLVAALVAAQNEMTPVAKDRENPYFRSNYATLKAITDMLRPILAKHGIGYVQSVENVDGAPRMVTTIIHAESGENVASAVPFACADTKPQAIGSAITYMKRYGLQCAFGVVVAEDETDDDGNRANGNVVKPVAAKHAYTVDVGVCPCGSVKGKKWTEIDTETLKKVLAVPADKVKAITAAHRNAIASELGRRETAEDEVVDAEVVEG